MKWAEANRLSTGKPYPCLAGIDDVPGPSSAYEAREWPGTPSWVRSACEANVSILAAIDRPALKPRAARAWQRLDSAYEALHVIRARALVRAQRQVRAGVYPKRPPRLRAAQARERKAFVNFVKAARIDLSVPTIDVGRLVDEDQKRTETKGKDGRR